MKIGVAGSKGSLLQEFSFSELKERGVQAVELSVEVTLTALEGAYERLAEVAGEGLEPIIHLRGEKPDFEDHIWHLRKVLEKLTEWGFVRKLILHPCEEGSSRQQKRSVTNSVVSWLSACPEWRQFTFCLENLPSDPNVPHRFGDNLSEVAEAAKSGGVSNCFDTGHYFSGRNSPVFAELTSETAARIEHIHIHAFVDGQDHNPLPNDDGQLAVLVQRFRRLRPDYSGVFSIEISPKGQDLREAVFGSIDKLKEFLA